MAPDDPLSDFQTLPELVRRHAQVQPDRTAAVCGDERLSYAEFDAAADRVAASLQRDGLGAGDTIAICGAASNPYLVLFVGALRAGLAVAPLAPGSTPAQLAGMTADAGARHLFLDGRSGAGAAGRAEWRRRAAHPDRPIGR